MMNFRFSIVVPVYRGNSSLEDIVTISEDIYHDNLVEIIFVFDGGESYSWEKISELASKYKKVKAIKLSRNFGQHNATICGFDFVKSNYVITMDEDLQHHPKSIQQLIETQIKSNSDLVYGIYKERSHNWFRNITSSVLKLILKIGMPKLHQDYTSFRLIKGKIAKETINMCNSYTFLDGYLSWITSNISSVKVMHYQSKEGKSSYSTRKLIKHTLNIFLTFSTLPIRFLTIISFLFFTFSSSYTIYIIISKLLNENYAAGFPTLITFLGFGFGFVLLGMGILGEYIQRINQKTTNRPNFIVTQIIDDSIQ